MRSANRWSEHAGARVTIFSVVVLAALAFGVAIATLVSGRPSAADPSPTPSESSAPLARETASVSPSAVMSPMVTPSPTPSPEPTGTPLADDPEIGRLVFSMAPWSDIVTPYTMSLMEDGRLTTIRLGGGADALSQRRLTPEGVDIVRQEILATGLFDESAFYGPVPRPGHELPGRGNRGFRVELGTIGGIVEVGWVVVTEDEVEWAEASPERQRLDELGDRLTSLDAWLPASAWTQDEAESYVPVRHRLFSVAQPWGGAPDDLPPEVSVVAWPLEGAVLTFGEETESSSSDYTIRCAVVEAGQAQAVIDALEAAGTAIEPLGSASAVGTGLGDRAAGRIVSVVLVALHPHETLCRATHPPSFW